MCRWLAYSGPEIYLETLLLKPANSLIRQSLSSQRGTVPTNGDGFGLGWYAGKPEPGLFRDTRPAWNDDNLRSISEQIASPLFFAHVRASTGTATMRPNCHPFRHDRWLFMHNGYIADFESIRRELENLIEPELFLHRRGTTDSEAFFYLLLSNGFAGDPEGALVTTTRLVHDVMAAAAIDGPLRLTAVATEGSKIIAVRYASDGEPPSLFHARCLDVLPEFGIEEEALMDETAFLIVSEPLDDVTEHWVEVPASSLLVASGDKIVVTPFEPGAD